MLQILEDMLRACVLSYGSKWEDCLPFAEFSGLLGITSAYYSAVNSSVKVAHEQIDCTRGDKHHCAGHVKACEKGEINQNYL